MLKKSLIASALSAMALALGFTSPVLGAEPAPPPKPLVDILLDGGTARANELADAMAQQGVPAEQAQDILVNAAALRRLDLNGYAQAKDSVAFKVARNALKSSVLADRLGKVRVEGLSATLAGELLRIIEATGRDMFAALQWGDAERVLDATARLETLWHDLTAANTKQVSWMPKDALAMADVATLQELRDHLTRQRQNAQQVAKNDPLFLATIDGLGARIARVKEALPQSKVFHKRRNAADLDEAPLRASEPSRESRTVTRRTNLAREEAALNPARPQVRAPSATSPDHPFSRRASLASWHGLTSDTGVMRSAAALDELYYALMEAPEAVQKRLGMNGQEGLVAWRARMMSLPDLDATLAAMKALGPKLVATNPHRVVLGVRLSGTIAALEVESTRRAAGGESGIPTVLWKDPAVSKILGAHSQRTDGRPVSRVGRDIFVRAVLAEYGNMQRVPSRLRAELNGYVSEDITDIRRKLVAVDAPGIHGRLNRLSATAGENATKLSPEFVSDAKRYKAVVLEYSAALTQWADDLGRMGFEVNVNGLKKAIGEVRDVAARLFVHAGAELAELDKYVPKARGGMSIEPPSRALAEVLGALPPVAEADRAPKKAEPTDRRVLSKEAVADKREVFKMATPLPEPRGPKGENRFIKDGKPYDYKTEVLPLKKAKGAGGGVHFGTIATVKTPTSDKVLRYEAASQQLLLVGPKSAVVLAVIEAPAMKALVRFSTTDENLAVSLEDNDQVRLAPHFVDTPVGQDLVLLDSIPWRLDDDTLPGGAPNPIGDRFAAAKALDLRAEPAKEGNAVFLDRSTTLTRRGLENIMCWNYMRLFGDRNKDDSRMTRMVKLSRLVARYYPQLRDAYEPMARVELYARVVALLRWVRESSAALIGTDFTSLAEVPGHDVGNYPTPDELRSDPE